MNFTNSQIKSNLKQISKKTDPGHARDAHEASVLSGCLRHTLDFLKIFYFLVYYARN
jgi:hypothetical protein